MLHPDLEALVGTVVHGRYRIDALLGVGGMGAVFRAHHTGLDRDVAIKILHPDIARDPSIGKRFEREATSASRLDHPNCVRVTDFGTTEAGITYLVMEMLEGSELADKLGSPWTAAAAIETATQILAGLEHAHHFGIVHRDLKPENVFMTTDYRGQELVKLVDFGIAKLIDEQGVEKLTRQGVVFGTPRYMSPEQAAGGKLDERTDLYAAGLILYEMLAGHPPFDADDAATLLRMQIMAPPPALPSSVPAALGEVVAKLLEKSKTDRYANAREVIDALAAAGKSSGDAPVAAVVAPINVAAASSSGASTMQLQTTPARGNLHAARSGAAWQPAGASTPTGNHQTIAYMPATRTGSHAGVGQASTGSYEALPSSQRSASFDTAASVSIAVRDEPPERRIGVWIGAAVAVLLVCVGIGAAAAFFSQSESSPAVDDDAAKPADEQPSEPAPAVISPGPAPAEPPAAPSSSSARQPATRPDGPDTSPSPKRTPSSIWSVIDDDDKDDDDARDNAKPRREEQASPEPERAPPRERDASDRPSGEAEPHAPPDERDKDKDESKGKGKDKDEGKGKGKGRGR